MRDRYEGHHEGTETFYIRVLHTKNQLYVAMQCLTAATVPTKPHSRLRRNTPLCQRAKVATEFSGFPLGSSLDAGTSIDYQHPDKDESAIPIRVSARQHFKHTVKTLLLQSVLA